MRLYLQHDVEIARWPALHAGVALLGIADSCAVFHARGNIDLHRALLHRPHLAFAPGARIGDHASRALARGAGAGNTEQPLLIAHLAVPAARRTGRRGFARSRSAAMALLAGLVAAHLDLSLFAEGGLFKGERQVGAGIAAALRP